jgi:hypothetical protein
VTSPDPDSSPRPDIRVCQGCGGRNLPSYVECDWCGKPFASPGRQLQLAGWQIASSILVLLVLAAFVALAFVNAGREIPQQRVAPTATAPAIVPSPVVTPRVTAQPTPTPRPTPTGEAVPVSTGPTPTPVPRARVINTGGSGVVVRAEPGPSARQVIVLREGTEVNITGAEQTLAARIWREVEGTDGSFKGWVSADFLQAI